MDTKAGESGGAGTGVRVHRQTHRVQALHSADAPPAHMPAQDSPCPSVLDVACFEAGDLNEFQRAVVIAHTRQCFRCSLSVAELREARQEILGPTPDAQTTRSQRAADEIETILRRRLH